MPPFICCFDTLGPDGMFARVAGCQNGVIGEQKNNNNEGDLGLLDLLLFLLRLGFRNSNQTLLLTNGSGLIPLGGDGCKVGTDNSTLMLHCSARALLGNFLRDTLLVHPAEDLRPSDLAGVFPLVE